MRQKLSLLATICFGYILNDNSSATDRVFAIFSKLCKIFKQKCQGSGKTYEASLRSKLMRVNFFYKVAQEFEHSNPHFQKSQKLLD